MSTTTTNLNMVLNEGQDKFSIPTLNENLTKIDTAIGEQNKNIDDMLNFYIEYGVLVLSNIANNGKKYDIYFSTSTGITMYEDSVEIWNVKP